MPVTGIGMLPIELMSYWSCAGYVVLAIGIALLTVLLLSCIFRATSSFKEGRYDVLISCREPTAQIDVAYQLFIALHDARLRVLWDNHELPTVDNAYMRCKVLIPIICLHYISSDFCMLELWEIVRRKRSDQVIVPIFCGGKDLFARIGEIEDMQYRQVLLELTQSPESVLLDSELPAFHMDWIMRRVIDRVSDLMDNPPRRGIKKWIHKGYKLLMS